MCPSRSCGYICTTLIGLVHNLHSHSSVDKYAKRSSQLPDSALRKSRKTILKISIFLSAGATSIRAIRLFHQRSEVWSRIRARKGDNCGYLSVAVFATSSLKHSSTSSSATTQRAKTFARHCHNLYEATDLPEVRPTIFN
jgi:hypothetical protein